MPKKKQDKTEESNSLSHAVKKRIYGWCPNCEAYTPPCDNPARCIEYIQNVLI